MTRRLQRWDDALRAALRALDKAGSLQERKARQERSRQTRKRSKTAKTENERFPSKKKYKRKEKRINKKNYSRQNQNESIQPMQCCTHDQYCALCRSVSWTRTESLIESLRVGLPSHGRPTMEGCLAPPAWLHLA
jgi:hypothetical protein